MTDELLTAEDVAARLRIGLTSAYQLMRRLPHIRVGRSIRLPAAERERVERLRHVLYLTLDYAGWENPAYVDALDALHPGDFDEVDRD